MTSTPAHPTPLRFRTADSSDARSIAALHADSWRRTYRGAYTDAFLDGDVTADRLAVWSERLRVPDPACRTILAEDDVGLCGFAHTVLDNDPTWGSLLENLHVSHEQQRRGIGARLLAATARAVLADATNPQLYLWVMQQNTAAQTFYEAQGGTRADSRLVSPPGGIPERLNGSPQALRYAWSRPRVLLHPTEPR